MVIHTFGHGRTYEMEALLKLFRPAEKFTFSTEPEPPAEGEYFSAVLRPADDGQQLSCCICLGGESRSSGKIFPADIPNNILERSLP